MALGFLLFFAQEFKTLLKALDLALCFPAMLLKCRLQICAGGFIRVLFQRIDKLALRIHHVIESVHKQLMACLHIFLLTIWVSPPPLYVGHMTASCQTSLRCARGFGPL